MEPWRKKKKREIVGYTYIHIYIRDIYTYTREKKKRDAGDGAIVSICSRVPDPAKA